VDQSTRLVNSKVGIGANDELRLDNLGFGCGKLAMIHVMADRSQKEEGELTHG
jgi:hypothetical protein